MSFFQKPKVAVITLNYNQIDYTVDCVKSLLKSDYPNFEIILVDNGSSEENFKILKNRLPKDPRLNLPRLETNRGYVGGINFGLKKANETNCEYFLIINNDTLIDENAINELVITSQKYHGNAIVSGKVYNYDERDTLQYIGNVYGDKKVILDYKSPIKGRREKDTGQYDEEMEMAMTDDIMWVIPIKIFKDIGYYSDYFFLYGEQNDYALRAQKKGYKLIYTPKAKIWHKGGITTDGGKKWLKSPKIEYWGTLAVLKIIELHVEKKLRKKVRNKFLFKNGLKKIILFFVGKIHFKIVKSHFLAIRDFKAWNRIRFKDNGYNPFN